METKVYLDDIRVPVTPNWIIVRTVEDFKRVVIDYQPTYISFDHDLGEDSPTGYDCAKWLVEIDYRHLRDFNVHSANPIGKENIETLLNNYLKHLATL